MATYYDQHYFGKSYTGEYLSGTVTYGKRLWEMLTFSASVVESSNGQGTNALGFVGNVNFFHRFKGWQTSGQFSYAQNVQSLLVTYTTSYYNYSAQRAAPVAGGHDSGSRPSTGTTAGLPSYQGDQRQQRGYSTSLGSRRFTTQQATIRNPTGFRCWEREGWFRPCPTPGVTNFILFSGSVYGGGFSVSPVRRLIVSGSFSRAISNTVGQTDSRTTTWKSTTPNCSTICGGSDCWPGTLASRRASARSGAPANSTSYFVGITRWFDFF